MHNYNTPTIVLEYAKNHANDLVRQADFTNGGTILTSAKLQKPKRRSINVGDLLKRRFHQGADQLKANLPHLLPRSQKTA